MSVRLFISVWAIALGAAASAVPVAAQPRSEAAINPRALELFERDWALMHWAIKRHDRDGDRTISLAEANRAALAFKQIADGDADGRVTPYEYARAREFIIARY